MSSHSPAPLVACLHFILAVALLIIALGIPSSFAQQNSTAPANQTQTNNPTTTAPATPAPIGDAATGDAATGDGTAVTAPSITKRQSNIEPLTREFEALLQRAEGTNSRLKDIKTDDAELIDIRLKLEKLSDDLLKFGVSFRPKMRELSTRLDQLGAPPAENPESEPAIVRDERTSLATEKAGLNALLGRAEDLSLQIDRSLVDVAERRRQSFSNTLFKQTPISRSLFTEVFASGGNYMSAFVSELRIWSRFVLNFRWSELLIASAMSLFAALILLFGFNRVFSSNFLQRDKVSQPSYFQRLSVGFWGTIIPSGIFAFFLLLIYGFGEWLDILRPNVAPIIASLFLAVSGIYFVYRLGRAVFAPRFPNWRLIPVTTKGAWILSTLTLALVLVYGLDYFTNQVNARESWPLSFTIGKSLVTSLLIGLLIIALALVRPFGALTVPSPEPLSTVGAGHEQAGMVELAGKPVLKPDGEVRATRRWPRWISIPLILIGLFVIGTGISGYVGLSKFVATQVVVTGAILITMYIGMLSARAIGTENTFEDTTAGRYLANRYEISDVRQEQFGLLSAFGIYALVLVIGLPLMLLQWGFEWIDVRGWMLKLFTGFQVGSVNISLLGLLIGVFVFVAGYLLTRVFQRWLDSSILARSRVETGVRNSIRTGIGYLGLGFAALIALLSTGIDLSSLAIVAGALSLGIGFGLQNIVQNFVSGLILLIERPIKVGDWIVAGGFEGTVKKISVRATEVETFSRQSVIIPNSEFINSPVGNWTHKNKLGRVEVPIGVAYGSDLEKVRDILMDLLVKHEKILSRPEPMVVLTAYGASSIDFEMRGFLADIGNKAIVASELNFSINEVFGANDIEIPFPQQDLHIKSLAPGLAKGLTQSGSTSQPSKAPAKPKKPTEKKKTT